MQTERTKKPDVLYDEAVSLFFNDLIDTLLEEDYFSFAESALDYVSKMIGFIEKNIHLLPHRLSPHYFSKLKPASKCKSNNNSFIPMPIFLKTIRSTVKYGYLFAIIGVEFIA